MMPGKLTLECKLRWWAPIYVHTLIFFCVFMGRTPDIDRVAAFLVEYGYSYRVRLA